MKNFIDYYRVQRLTNVTNVRIRFGYLQMFLLFLILNQQILGSIGLSFDTVSFLAISMIFLSISYLRTSREISHATLYPLSKRKKLVHHLIYTVISIAVFWLIIIILMLIILLIVYLVNPSAITSGESVEELKKPLYYYGWVLSYTGFTHILVHIKQRKKWWFTYLFGTVVYISLNVLVLSLLNNKFTILGSITELFNVTSNFNILNYGIGAFLILSFVGFIALSIVISKPRKRINYL